MKKNARSWKERICALLLAAVMVITWMLPNAALTAEAAPRAAGDTADVYFSVQDGQNDKALTQNVKIAVYKDSEKVREVSRPETEGQYKDTYKVDGLSVDEKYTYTIEKTGYEYTVKNDTADKRTFTPKADVANNVTVKMQMEDIKVNPSLLTLKVGESATVQVTNKVEELEYKWNVTSGGSYVTVDNGKVTAIAGGNTDDDQSATVTVSAGNKDKEIQVTVQKNDVNMSLSVIEPSGIDQGRVTLTANGLPDDASGKLEFKVEGTLIDDVDALTSRSVEYLSEDLIGSKSFSVDYAGNTKYKAASATATGTYTKTQELKITNTETSKKVTYGEDDWKEPVVISLDPDSIKGRTISAAAEFAETDAIYNSGEPGNAVDIEVDKDAGTVKVTPKNAGNIKIVITAEKGSTDYETATTEYTLNIERKTISLSDVVWDQVSKIYNGNTEIELTGTVSGTSEKITIGAANANTESKNVMADGSENVMAQDVTVTSGTYYSTVENGTANNQLVVEDTGNTIEDIATINYRSLYLTAETAKVDLAYGQDIKEEIEEMSNLVTLLNDTGAMQEQDDTGLVPDELPPAELPGATIEGDDTKLHLGEHKIVIPHITVANKISGNYEFKFENNESYKGTVTISKQVINQEQLMQSIVLADATGLYGITEGDSLNKIFASVAGEDVHGEATDNPVIKLTLNKSTDLGEYYDNVFISLNGEEAVNATTDGISLDVIKDLITGKTDNQKIDDVKIYLGRNDWKNTTTNEVNMADWLYVDNKAPEAAITGLTPTAYSEMANAVTFGLFTNKIFNATISVTDEGSGIATNSPQQYYVWKMGKDITDEDLTKSAIRTKIEEITEWENLDLTNGTATIPVGEGEKAEVVADNYLIFIKTVDNADNCSVYVSNGMVIDVTQPEINCTFVPATATQDGIDNYQGDANYQISIKDPEAFFSGIDSVQVDVTVNGQKVDSGIVIDSIDETTLEQTYEYSFKIELEDNDKLYSDLVKESDFTINAVVPARAVDPDLNDVIITITTKDKAGNEAQAFEKKIVIDNISPKVEVSYNDDINKANNDIYFNNKEENRIMTVKYTERNMDIGSSEDPYPDINFDIAVNGDEYDGVHLNELSQYGITWVNEEVKDYIGNKPISDFDVTEYTEARTCTIQLEFDKDGEYSITPHCEDILGNRAEKITYANETSKANEFFIIDQTAPVVTVVYSVDEANDIASDIEEAISEDKRVYTNRDIHALISIEEKNFSYEKTFAENQSDFSATIGTDAPEGIEDFSKFESRSEWSYDATNTGKTTLDFVKDANYIFSFTYTDLAGNSYTYAPHYFTFDQTEPTGTIKVDGADNSGILKDMIRTISFGFFFNDDTQIEFISEDATSVYKQQYYMYNPGDIHGSVDQLDIQGNTAHEMTLENITIDEWIGGADYQRINNPVVYYTQANTQQVPYMRLEDKAGNVSFISTAGVIDDRQAPDNAPKITITTAEPLHGIYNKDVDFEIQVIDPKVNGTYSGLKEVSYEILKDGEVTQSGNYNNEMLDATQRMQSITRNETVEAEINNSNNVQIKVTAVDQSGNKATETKNISIDVTDPTINVTYDLNSPLNDRYYNQTRTATVTVTERNFDPSAVRFNITNTDGTQPSISGWSDSSDSGVSDEATHTCTVTFAADGDYTFTLNTTDLAGNASNYTRVDDFTIDQTDPTIQVSYDNNNDAEPGYFNANRTATITVTEHNFNAAEVNAAITASLEGRGVAAPGLGGWSTRGDVHTASVTFSADADYTFDVDYTDLAGNAAADYAQDSFTIDQTAPEIEFFDIEDKSANNDVVAPGIRYSDNNYTENGVELTLTGANNGSMDIDGDHSSIPNGESIKMADFERIKENDDLYTLSAVITDRAGNETEDSVIFSVNRFGSVYIISDETKEWLNTGEGEYTYINEEQDIEVTEINVDSIVASDISYGRDGRLVDLEAGTDYEVKASGSDVSWKQYDYTINKENFEKEGNYTVTIDSEDRATNVGNSRAKGCNIEFAVDKTAPTIVITGIENDAQYRANTRNIVLNAADNIAMGDVGVYVGDADDPAQSYDAKAIRAAGGELTYTMSSSNSRQDIRAVATDAAGNTAEAEITRVLLTSNLFVQFYSNTPLLVGTIVGVVVIAGGLLWFFLVYKRKKDEEAQANK